MQQATGVISLPKRPEFVQISNYSCSFFNTCQVRNGHSIFMTYVMKGRWVSCVCTYACTCTHFCDNWVKAFILGILVWLIRLLFSNIWSCGRWQKGREVCKLGWHEQRTEFLKRISCRTEWPQWRSLQQELHAISWCNWKVERLPFKGDVNNWSGWRLMHEVTYV